MKRFFRGSFLGSLLLLMGVSGIQAGGFQSNFKNPPMKYRPQPFYFWNDSVKAEVVAEQMKQLRDHDGYGGFSIFGFGKNFKPEYLSDDYFQLYGKTIAAAKKLKLSLSLYDEYGFPSGGAGAMNADGKPRFKNKFPDQTLKRLDKYEEVVTGPSVVYRPLPAGKIMSVVGIDTLTFKRYDLTNQLYANRLKWHVPKGTFKIMYFTMVVDTDPLVDYLDPEAVKDFVSMTHQAYFERFHASFGKTLVRSFFDEPTMYRAKGRIWTGNFNEKFRDTYGYYPYLLYPALWYNIGPETEAIRNMMFGLRTELYAEGFTKVVSDWSVGHMLQATGHQDQEEVVNPVSVSGDLMKAFKYLDIPGIDKIGGPRPAERFYKIVSSAANNWDKPYVMSETFGAMGNLSIETMYSIVMDQYAKGVNLIIPHAVWYNDQKVTFLPELSYRNSLYKDKLPEFNKFISRLNVVLQAPGRHVADVAILYPIHTLQGEHHFDGPLKSTFGGVVIPRTDYVDVSNLLIDSLGTDFTFLHPEVFSKNCTIENNLLKLNNKINFELFQTLVLPSMKTISTSNMADARKFYESGGKLIFTTRLPWKGAQLQGDSIVQEAVRGIFPELNKLAVGDSFPERTMEVSNAAGGKAFLIPNPTAENLRKVLQSVLLPDVAFEQGKPLEYLHKVRDEKDVYFFANAKDKAYSGVVALKGSHQLTWLDPHTGKSIKALTSTVMRQNQTYTLVDMNLAAQHSTFLVAL
ncbi:MAG TPA: glycosyl hydrolase [Bacteroidales bacterium]|nr:glycosyl hydrolase [Bacteroidales bacterium]